MDAMNRQEALLHDTTVGNNDLSFYQLTMAVQGMGDSPHTTPLESVNTPTSSALLQTDEQMRLTEALRLSRERFDLVHQSIELGQWYCDLPFDKLDWNDTCKKHFGLPADAEVTIDLFYELLHPNDRERTRLAVERSLAEHSSYDIDYRTIGPDGQMRWIRAIGKGFYDESGEAKSFDGITIDITDRKRVEEKVQAQAELLELAHDAILVLDLHNVIQYWNHGAEEMYGWSANEAVGQTSNVLLQTRFPQSLEAIKEQVFETGQWEGELVHVRRDGTEIISHSRWAALYDADRVATSILEINRDITERKDLERRKDEFISMASHELKTPITSLKGFAQVLHRRLQKDGDEQTLRFLTRMDGQLDKLTQLINDLLDISKIQTGKLAFRKEEFDFTALVRDIVEDIQATTQTHQIELLSGLHGTHVTIFGDRDRLGQVLINFLTNAIKYSPNANRVIVRTCVNEQQVTVSIQDFGIGIDEAHQQRIFERFYQVDDSNKIALGLGIGLYISNEIIVRHHGHISVVSKKDEGSTFRFTIPLNGVSE
jgi:PAS domain S-box-containing protein